MAGAFRSHARKGGLGPDWQRKLLRYHLTFPPEVLW